MNVKYIYDASFENPPDLNQGDFWQMNYFKHKAKITNDLKFFHKSLAIREKLVNEHLLLAKHAAKRMAYRLGLHYEDLLGEANFSLIIAIDKFKFNLGFKFSTYATWVIIRRFKRSSETKSTTLLSDEVLNSLPDKIEESLEEQRRNKETIARILESLGERERQVIREFFGIGCERYNLLEIGKHLNISDERARQLKNRGLAVIKSML